MGKDLSVSKQTFFFCDGSSCQKKGGEQVVRSARAYLRNNGLWNSTHTIKTRCNGRCEDAPTCIVQSGDFWYKNLNADKIKDILVSHIEQQKPVEEYLLYQEGWGQVVSDKSLPPFQLKPFTETKDEQLGDCQITKGFSSDQYLYPLFLFLQENPKGVRIQLKYHPAIPFNQIQKIKYEDPFIMELITDRQHTHHFHIGPIPKSETLKVQQQKITSTEYFILTHTPQKGIRFKDKMGRLVAMVYIDSEADKVWDYCLGTQLNFSKQVG